MDRPGTRMRPQSGDADCYSEISALHKFLAASNKPYSNFYLAERLSAVA